MVRTTVAILGSLTLLIVGQTANATVDNIEFMSSTGGRQVIVDVDIDGNGPAPGDCDFRATFDPMTGAFTLTSTQPINATHPILGCDGTTSGTLTFGLNLATILMTLSSYGSLMSDPAPGMDTPLTVPGSMELGMQSGAAAPLTFGAPDVTFPINVDTLKMHVPADGPVTASVTLCNLNGPAGIFNVGGTSILVPFSFFTTGGGTTFLKMPNFPYERSDGFAFLDVYLPISGHKIIAALESTPDSPLGVIDFDALGPCPGRNAAPTMTEAGLTAVLVLLLVAGTWLLGRRATFYESLPTV